MRGVRKYVCMCVCVPGGGGGSWWMMCECWGGNYAFQNESRVLQSGVKWLGSSTVISPVPLVQHANKVSVSEIRLFTWSEQYNAPDHRLLFKESERIVCKTQREHLMLNLCRNWSQKSFHVLQSTSPLIISLLPLDES